MPKKNSAQKLFNELAGPVSPKPPILGWSKHSPFKPFVFTWGWCKQCEGAFVRCPVCSNNHCNATCGELNGKKCPYCELGYQYQTACSKQEPTEAQVKKAKGKFVLHSDLKAI
jgi:hypothetical protein